MLSLSPLKLLIVVMVGLVVLGPDKVPQVARQVAHAWRAVREFRTRIEGEIRETMPDLPSTTDIARMARSPVQYLNRLAEMPTKAVDATKTELRHLGFPHSEPASAPDAASPSWEPGTVAPGTDANLPPGSGSPAAHSPLGELPIDPGMN